jgi:hypothetical protein
VQVPWTALERRAATARPGAVLLEIARPELVTGGGVTRRPGDRLRLVAGTDPVLLANAINWYLHFPDRRPNIGTASELDRLTMDLAAWVARWSRPAARAA